ncbi:hypothetical protein ACSQ67_013173 [Phaseolus vulgaris]
MALKIQLTFPFSYSVSSITLSTHKLATRISCTAAGDGGISDAALASELAVRVARMNAHSVKAEEAMSQSRKLLFGEMCEYMGLNEEQAQDKWSSMDEEEKLVLVKGFLKEWGSHFHPLSARSTKEMLEEYLCQRKAPPKPPSSPSFFSGLSKIIGFP